MKRWEFERAVLASDLPASARLILLALAVLADWPGGCVPAKYGPSLTTLAKLAGLSRSGVAAHLNEIEKTTERDGWVMRMRPTKARAQAEKERTQYQLSIPTSPGVGLAPAQDSRPTSPTPGLASPTPALALVQELDGASPGVGHNQTSSRPSSSSSPRGPVADIAAALSTDDEEAQEIYTRIASDPNINAPSRYIRSLIESGDIAKFRAPAKTPPVNTHPFVASRGGHYCDTCGQPATHARHGGKP